MTCQRTIALAAKVIMPCSVVGQCKNIATRSRIKDVLGSATTSTLSPEKAFPALAIQQIQGVHGAPRLDFNVPMTNGMAKIQDLVADARFTTTKDTAKVFREIANTFKELVHLKDASRWNR